MNWRNINNSSLRYSSQNQNTTGIDSGNWRNSNTRYSQNSNDSINFGILREESRSISPNKDYQSWSWSRSVSPHKYGSANMYGSSSSSSSSSD